MITEERTRTNLSYWEPVPEAFLKWLNNREKILEPGLAPEPTIKVLIFLALYDAAKPCTYDEIKEIFKKHKVIKGSIPDNTLRTSVSSLSKTLEKFAHPFELKSLRGRFQLKLRTPQPQAESNIDQNDQTILLLTPAAITPEEVAYNLIEKAMLSFSSLYFLEWSARWWETYSSKETEVRVKYEADAWELLGIKERISKNPNSNELISMVGLAPGEGLAEIELLKRILADDNKSVHYLAIDSSPKLLRDHIGLLKETLSTEIKNGRLITAGIVADIFTGIHEALSRTRQEFKKRHTFSLNLEFLPPTTGMLITYLGNCLGNNSHDQETEFFFMLQSVFQNRPLEILVGTSVMRSMPDIYIRNWDNFLLQTPRHLLETMKLLKSSRNEDSAEAAEFTLSENSSKDDRCPTVAPEQYIARHQIEGQIYRFYYKLAYDLNLAKSNDETPRCLPKGSLIQLYSIIKYNMPTLVKGIEKCGLLKVKYDPSYHQIMDTPNGVKDYAVFCAYIS